MKYKNPVTGEVKDIYVKLLGDTLPIGVVLSYPGSSAPTNWLICDGSAVSRTTYANLFAIIGTTYGAGDGSTTFNLPNYKGRTPVGFDSTQTEFNVIGKTGGEKTHKIIYSEMPAHNHDYPVTYPYKAGAATWMMPYCDTNEQYATGFTGYSGGNQPHNNLQPYIAQNYIIKAFQSIGVIANVAQTKTNSDNDVYSCNYINNIENGISNVDTRLTAAESNINNAESVIGNETDTYSASSTYVLGSLVIYNSLLYKCTTAITVAEAWNSAKWTQVNLVDISSGLNGTVLYDNPSGGHGTLNLIRECDSSIKKVKIYCMDDGNYQKSIEIILGVSNKFELTFNYYNSQIAVHKYSRLHIDNTQVVEEVQGTASIGASTYSWDNSNSNNIRITKVIGYKEV